MSEPIYKVLVLDMQPIDPPVGGGRLRLLGLYHALGKNLPTTYVGTYDWPGEKYRDHKLSETLREINIPLSADHFSACQKWQERAGGKTIIDVTFHQLGHLSPAYVERARDEVMKADIVIFSHPWVYPLVKDCLRQSPQLVVYDSHNVEGFLRATLLDDDGFGTDIVREVVQMEYDLCHAADLVLTCSQEDRELFNRLYDVELRKMEIVPNGVFASKIVPVAGDTKKSRKKELGLPDRTCAIFIGSPYGPNAEAADFICEQLAHQLPDVHFIIAGGVGEEMIRGNVFTRSRLTNVHLTGHLTDEKKLTYLSASDFAVNPMFSGSGTNIKMFDFMAAGLPIISTGIGARGICETTSAGVIVASRDDFAQSIAGLANDTEQICTRGADNRALVEKSFSWEKLSPDLGILLREHICTETYTIDALDKSDSPRAIASALDSSEPGCKVDREINKIALLSTWNIRCGIAEYTKYLAEGLELNGVEVLIIANSNGDEHPSVSKDTLKCSNNVHCLWSYDNHTYCRSDVEIRNILSTLKSNCIKHLNVQYHPVFFAQRTLVEVLKWCNKAGITVSVTLHNSEMMDLETLVAMNNLGAVIIVHTVDQKVNLHKLGIKNVGYLQQGVLDFPDEDVNACRLRLELHNSPIIGSFGFLREHKGVLELIESIHILKRLYPNILLLGLNALYPSKDSEEYYADCINKIKELRLDKNVLLKTEFMSVKDIIDQLHASDVIVLPYYESDEGASATANMAIAARRPLLTSHSLIFTEVKDVSYRIEQVDPQHLADTITTVIKDQVLQEDLKRKVVNYGQDNSWANVANKFLSTHLGGD